MTKKFKGYKSTPPRPPSFKAEALKSQEIRTMGEIYETINHVNVKGFGGGIYIGVAFGVAISVFNINRHANIDITLFGWLIGLGVLSLAFGAGLLWQSGMSFKLEE